MGGAWDGGGLNATTLNTLSLRGDRRSGLAGDLTNATIDLAGAVGLRGGRFALGTLNVSRNIDNAFIYANGDVKALKATNILGDPHILDDPNIHIDGNVRSLNISQNIDNSIISIDGNVRSFIAATINDSKVYVGYNKGLDDFSGGHYTINSLRLTDRDASNMTGDSWIACNLFRNVSMAYIDGNNDGIAFGYITGNTSSRISIRNPRWSWDSTDGDGFGDFVVRLI